jgi:hypothetical protein
MTICRTTELGGITGASARAAGGTRIDSHPDGARAASVIWAARTGHRLPATRRAQPPDYETLVRVRDGLMRL